MLNLKYCCYKNSPQPPQLHSYSRIHRSIEQKIWHPALKNFTLYSDSASKLQNPACFKTQYPSQRNQLQYPVLNYRYMHCFSFPNNIRDKRSPNSIYLSGSSSFISFTGAAKAVQTLAKIKLTPMSGRSALLGNFCAASTRDPPFNDFCAATLNSWILLILQSSKHD